MAVFLASNFSRRRWRTPKEQIRVRVGRGGVLGIFCKNGYLYKMKKGTLVCDFSGAYGAQGFLGWLEENAAEAQVLELKGLEGTSCYCDAEAALEIGRMLPGNLPGLRWLDSGDYHYMSHLLALREMKPFHLLLLDNHPDNQEPAFGGGVLSCGSWVKAMREENPLLADVLWIGPENGDYLEWMEDRRGERLYISLDKDVMAPQWARTDWSQGEFGLEQVEEILKLAMTKMDIAAIDICGEISASKGATPEDMRINFETNTKLYNLICQN